MSSTHHIAQGQPHELTCSNFSCFPVEIVRLIFEHSGRDSGEMAARLVCVSNLVHTWLLPVLYETLVIKWPRDFHQLRRNIASNPQSTLALHVRHIRLQVQTVWNDSREARAALSSEVVELLVECRNVRSMYLNTMSLPLDYTSPDQLPHISELHCGSWAAWMTHDIMAFHSLTHLRVDLAFNFGVRASWMPLLPPSNKLPNLTHLAIGSDQRNTTSESTGTKDFLRGILLRPKIVMLVVMAWFCWSGSDDVISKVFADPGQSDPRLCVLMTQGCPGELSSVKEWEDAARGRGSIWDKAESAMRLNRERGRRQVAVGIL